MAVITRLYDKYDDAQNAMQQLVSAGLPQSDISIVANNADNSFRDRNGKVDRDGDGVDDRAEGGSTGAGVGATLGGAAGLLAGLGFMAIPGIGTRGRSRLAGIHGSRRRRWWRYRRHSRRVDTIGRA